MATRKKAPLVRKPAPPVKPEYQPDPNVVDARAQLDKASKPAPLAPPPQPQHGPNVIPPPKNQLAGAQLAGAPGKPLQAGVENEPFNPSRPNYTQARKLKPLTPAQQEYKRIYPNTVYPEDWEMMDVPQTNPVLAAQLAGIKAQVDAALADTKLGQDARRKLDEVFGTPAKEG